MKFPLLEAFLVQPEEGTSGKIGICTNTLSPTLVINEIPFDKRSDVAVLGSLIVNRDGAERLILNCLSHDKIEYVILFGEETLSFRPSTNLLSAVMKGYKEGASGNLIDGGIGVSHHYPSISPKLLDLFRNRVKLIPMYTHHQCDETIKSYMKWLEGKVPPEVHSALEKIHQKKKVYYDSLLEMISVISAAPSGISGPVELDPSDFQHLKPPVIELEDDKGKSAEPEAGFKVTRDGGIIKAEIDFGREISDISGNDSFLMAYSIMEYARKNSLSLPRDQQIYLGAELSRVETEINSGIMHKPLVKSRLSAGIRTQMPVASRTMLKADKKYYYKINVKDGKVAVQNMAHDTCETVFELRCKSLMPILRKINENSRFEEYEQEFLHRMDVGIEASRAAIALESDSSFFQDFRNLFKINMTKFPLLLVEGDTFLGVHRKLITSLYTKGITEQHPDTQKGPMRSASILATFRNSPSAMAKFPAIYSSGSKTTEEMRAEYKDQLSSPACEGTYTYGERTRAHFGYDQLERAAQKLKENPGSPAIIQRFDYTEDMTITETPVHDSSGNVVRTRIESTHDPCLTHDIYFVSGGKLHSFHIARAHNIVNAYPENIFGLFDAYDTYVAEKAGLELGDFFMLSNRGNILLLNEEQKAKKIIAEPSKPDADFDSASGPFCLDGETHGAGVGYAEFDLKETDLRPDHPCLDALENYDGINLVEKAADYLKKKGKGHNNPIMGTYNPRKKELGEANRLVFFQCNKTGGKLYASAVFINGGKTTLENDTALCNYLATQYSRLLGEPLGKLSLFYAPLSRPKED